MKNNSKIKNRKSNRLKGYDYSQAGWYFITICVKNKEPLLGEIINGKMNLSAIGIFIKKCWLNIPKHFPNVKLDTYIIMPNHIHGIVIIENSNTVGNKNFCSKNSNNNSCSDERNYRCFDNNDSCCSNNRNNNYCSLQQSWQTKWSHSLSSVVRGFKIGITKWCRENNCEYFMWQKSFYDHIIRNEKSLNKIRQYIINNPLQWELDKNKPENLWM